MIIEDLRVLSIYPLEWRDFGCSYPFTDINVDLREILFLYSLVWQDLGCSFSLTDINKEIERFEKNFIILFHRINRFKEI